MGINLHLVDQRSPRAFTVVIPARHSVNQILRMQRQGLTRRDLMYPLRSLVGPSDTMTDVVNNILSQYGPPRRLLDVIRIEAHGIVPQFSAIVAGVQFGSCMDNSTVSAFTRIRPLWRRAYAAVPPSTPYDTVIPRIECHGCEPVPGCDAMLQALANAALAPVFASSAAQIVHAGPGQNPYAIEPPVFRFHLGGSGAQRV